MKSIITAIALGFTVNASATIVDLEIITSTFNKEDQSFFKKAVSLVSETENQEIRWKSKTGSYFFTTVFPKEVQGQICKEYQLAFDGGYSQGTMCKVHDTKWVFVE